MIHRHPWGSTIDIIRRDGHWQIYRVRHGCERQAKSAIGIDLLFGRLTDYEAGQLLKGVNQILGNESPVASSQPLSPSLGLREKMLSLARAAIDRVARLLAGRAEDECEMGGGK